MFPIKIFSFDLYVVFLNGIPVTDINGKNPRIDKRYPYVRLVYEQLDEGRFFYGRCLAQKTWHDERYLTALYSAVLDMYLLNVTPSMYQTGREQLTASAFAPGTMSQVSSGTEVGVLYQPKDFGPAVGGIQMVERNLEQESVGNMQSGQQSGKSMTARETVLMNQNAELMMTNFMRNQMSMVEDFGNLLIGDILQHITVGEVDELTDSIQYKTVLLREKNIKGKNLSTVVRFAPESPEDKELRSLELLDEVLSKNMNATIYEVNPEMLRSIKYKCYVSADTYKKNNKDLQKALALEYYQLMQQNPIADQNYLFKRITEEFYPGEADNFTNHQQPMQGMPGQPPVGLQNPMSQQLSMANGLKGGNVQNSAGGGMPNNQPVGMG